jgi:hypothetical protein
MGKERKEKRKERKKQERKKQTPHVLGYSKYWT